MMILKKSKKEIWKSRLLNQRSSGKDISNWCTENNLHRRSFYYWKEKIFPKKIDRLNFVEIKAFPNSSSDENAPIIIKYHGAEISIAKDFDIKLLKKCLKALQGIQCL
jgi:hypothetical protein